MGIVDFDVLDGVDEFLDACELVGLRGSAGIETRVFVPEFATREINSPGEPGVCYQMGIGFASGQAVGRAAEILADLRQRATDRNRGMLARVNAHLALTSCTNQQSLFSLRSATTLIIALTQSQEPDHKGSGSTLRLFATLKGRKPPQKRDAALSPKR